MPKLKVTAQAQRAERVKSEKGKSRIISFRVPEAWVSKLEDSWEEYSEECESKGEVPPASLSEWIRRELFFGFVSERKE